MADSMNTEGIYTHDVSEKVADGLQYFMLHPDDKRYFELSVVRYSRRTGNELPTPEEFVVSIRLIEEMPRIVPRAGGGEIARCITREGKRIDIIFGNPARRSFEPASVELED